MANCNGGNWVDRDFWVYEILKDDTVHIITSDAGAKGIWVYPNPAKDYILFEVQSTKVKTGNEIRILDTYGREVFRMPVSKNITVWDTKDIDSGIYFYNFRCNTTVQSGTIIIAK